MSQSDALSKSNTTEEKMSRIPLVLTYHPLNTRVQRILLDNFKVTADYPATSLIFPRPPMVAFRRDGNVRTSLVHTAAGKTRAGTYPCTVHVDTHVVVLVATFPAKLIFKLTIQDSFTCLSSGLIYCITCRRCPAIYIGETGAHSEGTFW